ncbi:MAG: zincin-like metallopeptidase domain-containing protein, partial [Planctomycetota bacterium]
KDKQTGEEKSLPVLRHYTAFNIDQIDGIDTPDAPVEDPEKPEFQPIAKAEQIIGNFEDPPSVEHDGGRKAFYKVRSDSVHLPDPNRFDSKENYYATLFHEVSHSTGIEKRLSRGLDTDPAPFGSPDYSREELIAEISAAYLCAACGISPPTIEQSAAYLQGWIKVLKGDKRLVISAAGAAQKSADFILGDAFNSSVMVGPDCSKEALTVATETQLNLFPK